MSATEIAAWWGAVVATLVLVWDAYKWNARGARLRVVAHPNMTVRNVPYISEEDRFVAVTVYNTGDQPATISTIAGRHYKSRLHKFFRRENLNFLVVNPGFGPGLPAVVEPGGEWNGGISQEQLMESPGAGGLLLCGVCVSTSKQPVLVRVHLPENHVA